MKRLVLCLIAALLLCLPAVAQEFIPEVRPEGDTVGGRSSAYVETAEDVFGSAEEGEQKLEFKGIEFADAAAKVALAGIALMPLEPSKLKLISLVDDTETEKQLDKLKRENRVESANWTKVGLYDSLSHLGGQTLFILAHIEGADLITIDNGSKEQVRIDELIDVATRNRVNLMVFGCNAAETALARGPTDFVSSAAAAKQLLSALGAATVGDFFMKLGDGYGYKVHIDSAYVEGVRHIVRASLVEIKTGRVSPVRYSADFEGAPDTSRLDFESGIAAGAFVTIVVAGVLVGRRVIGK